MESAKAEEAVTRDSTLEQNLRPVEGLQKCLVLPTESLRWGET
jgi:hypothetical protein